MSSTRRTASSTSRVWRGKHRFEHWHRDNQVYFITARCRDGYPAFESQAAHGVFWDRLEHHASAAEFTLWVATLMNNHYHLIGYCKWGKSLSPMMQKLHGSVAKLTNDLLPQRMVPFWRERGSTRDYFDGCLRDEKQCRLAYRYTLTQAVRAKLVRRWQDYPNTKVWIDVDRGVKRALQLNAFMEGVPYKRYANGDGKG